MFPSLVNLIATAVEKGEHKLYKTCFATLGRQLYDIVLNQAHQSLFDEIKQLGKMKCKRDDQVEAVRKIVELITQDPPIAIVNRMIYFFIEVLKRRMKSNEDLIRFISRTGSNHAS